MNCLSHIVSDYLGVTPNDKSEVVEPETNKWFHYSYKEYNYVIVLNLLEKSFSVSVDDDYPFGPRSLFETYNFYDSIYISTEECYGNQDILYFTYPTEEFPKFISMQIVKWPSGKLSIWQATPPTKKI